MESLTDFKTIQQMVTRLTTRGKTQRTAKHYIFMVGYFLQFMKSDNPDELLESLRKNSENVPSLINHFIDREREVRAGKSVNLEVTAIKKWLSSNDVLVNWDSIDYADNVTVEEDRAPTKEELRDIIGNLNIRNKVFALMAVSSGMRIGTILSLTWGEIDLDSYDDVGKIVIKKASGRKFTGSKRFYVTWINQETKDALKAYRAYIESPDLETKKKDKIQKRVTTIKPTDRIFPITQMSITDSYHLALRKSGLTNKKHHFRELHFHTIRKFFRTQCEIAGVPRSFWDYWMGHTGGYLDESYFRADENEHLTQYRKAVPNLNLLSDTESMVKIQELETKTNVERTALITRITELEKSKETEKNETQKRIEKLERELQSHKETLADMVEVILKNTETK